MSAERINLEPPRQKVSVPRLLLLVFVFLGTALAYSRHYQSVANQFQRQDAIRDETGTLSTEHLQLLREAALSLREVYGVTLLIQVRQGPVTQVGQDPKILFIGLDTANGKAVVILPPLLAKALPPELVQSLENGYFDPYFAAGAWPKGLDSCVLAILEALHDQ